MSSFRSAGIESKDQTAADQNDNQYFPVKSFRISGCSVPKRKREAIIRKILKEQKKMSKHREEAVNRVFNELKKDFESDLYICKQRLDRFGTLAFVSVLDDQSVIDKHLREMAEDKVEESLYWNVGFGRG